MPSTDYHVPGPCTIEFNNQPLGVTKIGVIIRPRTNWAPVTDDKHGLEPADFILAGKSAQVEVLGLEVAHLKAANLFDDTGGLLFNTVAAGTIGQLASAIGKLFEIIERDTNNKWIANKAIPFDPETLTFVSTAELQVPLTFLIVPDDNDKLFVTVPTYIE